MAWEYLENLDNRYIIAADVIGELSGDVVLDVNSGNSRLGYYIKGDFKYYCNDLMDDRAQRKMSDWQFVRSYSACDVLCCFGIGGYEISGEELESATVTDSLKYAIGAYNPQWVVLECVEKFSEIQSGIMYGREQYDYVHSKNYNYGASWTLERVLNIWKR